MEGTVRTKPYQNIPEVESDPILYNYMCIVNRSKIYKSQSDGTGANEYSLERVRPRTEVRIHPSVHGI